MTPPVHAEHYIILPSAKLFINLFHSDLISTSSAPLECVRESESKHERRFFFVRDVFVTYVSKCVLTSDIVPAHTLKNQYWVIHRDLTANGNCCNRHVSIKFCCFWINEFHWAERIPSCFITYALYLYLYCSSGRVVHTSAPRTAAYCLSRRAAAAHRLLFYYLTSLIHTSKLWQV